MLKKQAIVFLLLMSFFCASCNREQLSKEIGEFDSAVTEGTETITGYYEGLNEREYDLYFQLLKLDPSFEVGDFIVYPLRDDKGKITETIKIASPLKQPPFPMESIETRVQLLKELTTYSRNLADLAGSDAPNRFDDNTQTLANNLRSLKNTFDNLGRNPARDPTASRYVAPIATIIGIVGKWALEKKRWDTLRSSIVRARNPINTILDQITEDLDTYVDPLIDLANNDRYTTAIVYYNLQKDHLSNDQRAKFLESIKEYKAAYDAALRHKPSEISIQMKKTHEALYKVAKYDRMPQDLATLRSEMSIFIEDVIRVRDAVRIIKGRKEK